MARFNPETYDPSDDSSPGAPKTGNLVLIYPDEFSCRCGCKGKPKSPKRRFIQGHDARLKGALSRAAIANVQVEIRQGKDKPASLTAVAASKVFGFSAQVAGAKARHTEAAKVAKAKADARAKVSAEKRSAIAAKKADRAKATKASKAKPAKKATKASKSTKKASKPTNSTGPAAGAVADAPAPEEPF